MAPSGVAHFRPRRHGPLAALESGGFMAAPASIHLVAAEAVASLGAIPPEVASTAAEAAEAASVVAAMVAVAIGKQPTCAFSTLRS